MQNKYYIKARHKPVTGVYYVACGKMCRAAAKREEQSAYGRNVMYPFDTQEEYKASLAELRRNGESVYTQ